MKPFLKIPVEFCQFSLSERRISQATIYLAGQFLFPGKVRIDSSPISEIASISGFKQRSIYNGIDWLLSRDWMGKDIENGWYFFRGLDYIHSLENWNYGRAVVMLPGHLRKGKAFFISAVVSSAIRTGTATGTGRLKGGPEQSQYPVPVSFLQKALNVSRRTAIRYFNIAKTNGFLDIQKNFMDVHNLAPNDVKSLKHQNIDTVVCQVKEGSNNDVRSQLTQAYRRVKVKSLRIDQGKVFLQGVNLIASNLYLTKRSIKKRVP